MWTLILHYQINIGFQEDTEEQESESRQSPKQALLTWIQKKLPNKNIKNFTTDWKSGVNVAALVDAVNPGLCPEHATMDESMALENARLAMERAEEWLDIPQVTKVIHNLVGCCSCFCFYRFWLLKILSAPVLMN